MRTIVNIEVSLDSGVYKYAWKVFPDQSAPERHVVVIAKTDKLANILVNAFGDCDDTECLQKTSKFYEKDAPWLLLEINGKELFVVNNSDLVLYHEQLGKTTCLTDPLFDFTHRLTWQDEEGVRVLTTSQSVVSSDDVIRIEESGLRVGKIVVKYVEDVYTEESEGESLSLSDVQVRPLRSKVAPVVLVLVIVLMAVGLVFGLNGSRYLSFGISGNRNEGTSTTSSTSTETIPGVESLKLAQTVTVAQLGEVAGKWLYVRGSEWYVSDGSYVYSTNGKMSTGTAKGLFVGKLWYIDSPWYLQYSEGMVHLVSSKGNKISLTNTTKQDFDAIVDFTAFSDGQTATVLIFTKNGIDIFAGQNYLSPKGSVSYPSGYSLTGVIEKQPVMLLLGNGSDSKIVQVGSNGTFQSVGSAEKSDWALVSSTEVYTITGKVLHTQSLDLQMPFTATQIVSVDGTNVLLDQPCRIVKIKL
jgi:hypothetical protein